MRQTAFQEVVVADANRPMRQAALQEEVVELVGIWSKGASWVAFRAAARRQLRFWANDYMTYVIT